MKINFNPIIEKFNQLELRVRYAVFIGILLLIFSLDLFIVIGFQWNALQKIDVDNQTLQQDIEHLKGDLQRINQMKAGLENFRSQLEARTRKIHPVGQVSSILEDISRIANANGIKIEQLTPQMESQKALISSGAIKYYALPIVIQASSGYHMFGRFMNQLELSNLFFTLGHLNIENRGEDLQNQSISATLKVVLSDKNTDGPKK